MFKPLQFFTTENSLCVLCCNVNCDMVNQLMLVFRILRLIKTVHSSEIRIK